MSDSTDPAVVPLGGGRFQVVVGSQHRVAYAVRDGGNTWVFLDGEVHVVSPARPSGRRSAAHDDQTALSAPMPATVIGVQTAPGQTVARGDVLVMLEAMKMELPIRAPRDGVVRRIACRAGDLVQPGVPLLDLD